MNYSNKIQLKSRLFNQFDDQKIDIVIGNDLSDPFLSSIFKGTIEL